MSVESFYSPVNPRRRRATKSEMEERAEFLIQYAAKHGPVTVRQLYYRAVVQGITGIEKTEAGYTKVQRQVLALRRAGQLPYRDIADSSRWMRRPRTWNSVEDALRSTAETYRKALWRDTYVELEVWLEKNALAGVIYPVTSLYDVALMPTIGYTSETFAFEAVASANPDKNYYVNALYDFDRSGRDACRSLKEKVERFAEEMNIAVFFNQIGISEEDIIGEPDDDGMVEVWLNGLEETRLLPTREHKRNTAADKNWPFEFAIELDAIEPDDLRAMVRKVIERDLPPEQLATLRAAEDSERTLIANLVASLRG